MDQKEMESFRELVKSIRGASSPVGGVFPPSSAKLAEKALAELEKQRWVSVEDEPPDKWQEVIAINANSLASTTAIFDGENFECMETGLHIDWYGGVTHWMPLPDASNA